jgi:ABC-2 type transport system permease protein
MIKTHKSDQEPIFSRPSKFFKPGTAIWLMRHHIRTRLRGKAGTSRVQSIVRNLVLLSFLAFAIVNFGGSIAKVLANLNGNYDHPPIVLKAGIILSAFVISLLGSSLISAYALFTDRDDLDLLLASPLPPQRILLARMLQSAYSAFFTATLMGTIVFGYAIVTVDLRFILIYPVLFSFMVFDLAISFVIARALLLRFGLRRGRTISMVAGFGVLICGVLAFQVNSQIGSPSGDKLLAELFGPNIKASLSNLLSPIGRLAFGHWPDTLGLFLAALAAFIGVGAFFWDRFAKDAALMAGQAQHVQTGSAKTKIKFSRGIFLTTVLKEWRSMLRDPFVIVQVATPLVSLIPLGLALWGLQRPGSALPIEWLTAVIGFLVVMFGGQVAGTLAWTAASIEEAGDLLLSSPADGGRLFWSKALATAIPSFAFLSLAMMVIAISDQKAALLGLAIGSIGLACCGAVEFLRPRPARRAKMTQRPDRSIMSVILGASFSMVWASAAAVAMAGYGVWALIPAGTGAVALAFVWATAPKSVVWMAKSPKIGAAGGPWKA